MSDVKWIKIVTDIFDDEKILLIESLPNADSIIIIWFKLLCLAGKNNNNGVFIMENNIAYTDRMLATIFRRNIRKVRDALKILEEYGLIETVGETYTIPNWGKYQTINKTGQRASYRKNYMKKYMKEYREKQSEETEGKAGDFIPGCEFNNMSNNEFNSMSNNRFNSMSNNEFNSMSNSRIKEKEKKKETETGKETEKSKENQKGKETEKRTETEKYKEKEAEEKRELSVVSDDTTDCRTKSVRRIMEKWNELSVYGITKVCKLSPSTNRYKHLIARMKEYGDDKVAEAIENIKTSDFLKGKNNRGWTITFDWFILPNNFPKVLDGNYCNRDPSKNFVNYDVEGWING